MFPIFDIRGNIVAFGGRVMDDSYPNILIHLKPLAIVRVELFGMNIAKKSTENKLLVVEGYMDVIYCISRH